MLHTYDGQTIRFEIKYKTQTSIRITVDHYENVEVQVPKGTSNEKVIQLLERNWEPIQQKITEMKDRLNGPQKKVYEHGESFLYLGSTYPIRIVQDINIEKDNVQFDGEHLHIHVQQLEDEKIKQAVRRFYYQQCKALVEKSVRHHQKHFKVKPRSIKISDSKTNWGTCDSKKQLTFNWRLAMAPIHVIDYVVVHEMCHMVHMNHDRSFWRLVGKIMPNYKEQEEWLAQSSWKMTV
jgi:predicted metal-dependent hydrolase